MEINFVYRFMSQICGKVPQTLDNIQEMIEMAAQLSTTFFIETFIHAKEKVQEYGLCLVVNVLELSVSHDPLTSLKVRMFWKFPLGQPLVSSDVSKSNLVSQNNQNFG